jgi:hypothetical protein
MKKCLPRVRYSSQCVMGALPQRRRPSFPHLVDHCQRTSSFLKVAAVMGGSKTSLRLTRCRIFATDRSSTAMRARVASLAGVDAPARAAAAPGVAAPPAAAGADMLLPVLLPVLAAALVGTRTVLRTSPERAAVVAVGELSSKAVKAAAGAGSSAGDAIGASTCRTSPPFVSAGCGHAREEQDRITTGGTHVKA